MGFNSVYRALQDIFPQVDSKLLRTVAIEHPNDADVAAEIVLTKISPSISKKLLQVHPPQDTSPRVIVNPEDAIAHCLPKTSKRSIYSLEASDSSDDEDEVKKKKKQKSIVSQSFTNSSDVEHSSKLNSRKRKQVETDKLVTEKDDPKSPHKKKGQTKNVSEDSRNKKLHVVNVSVVQDDSEDSKPNNINLPGSKTTQTQTPTKQTLQESELLHATSLLKEHPEQEDEYEKQNNINQTCSKHSPEANLENLKHLSIPFNILEGSSSIGFDISTFQSKLNTNAVAAIDDLLSSVSTSKTFNIPTLQGNETSKPLEITANQLMQELREIAFEKDLSENSSVSYVIDSFRPKLAVHKHLFTPKQLEGMNLVINIIEYISKVNGEFEQVKNNREQANQYIDQYYKEITATKVEILEQQKKMEESTMRKKTILEEIDTLKDKIKSLEAERCNIDSSQDLSKKHLEVAFSNAMNQASNLTKSRAKAQEAEVQMTKIEKTLLDLKATYANFKKNPPF